jgi:hypothetical protein
MNDVHSNDQYAHWPGRERSNSSRHAKEINRVLYTIAIVDQQQRTLFFPYFVDEVDEEPQLRKVTCSILSVMGYTVTEAASGEEAAEMRGAASRLSSSSSTCRWNRVGTGGAPGKKFCASIPARRLSLSVAIQRTAMSGRVLLLELAPFSKEPALLNSVVGRCATNFPVSRYEWQ